jgi:tetratricopeptide (TPR) repeat protein
MKKISIFLVLLLSISIMGSAQKSTRTTAFNYLKKGKLDLAKENIDKAVEHEKTMSDPKTWFYYGNTYIQLATTQDEAYKDLDPDALQKAYDGYLKCMELDENGTYKLQVIQDMTVIGNNYYARGLDSYNKDEYKDAFAQFNKAVEVNKSLELGVDTLAIYAAAMSAMSAEMNDEAKTLYTELAEMNYNKAVIYSDLATIYKNEGDLDMAKKTLQQGIEKFPNDAGTLFAKINILLEEKKYEEVIESLESAILLAPDNYTLYFVKGQSYESMKDLENAEAAYLKAIEVNPDYTDAYYNLGALHYNKGVEVYGKANDLPFDATEEYEKMTGEAKKHFLDAQPYFEKAFDALPDDANLKASLVQIYQKTDQKDKLSEINNM